MYIVENYPEAEKVAGLLLKDVNFVITGRAQFIAKDIESISFTQQPDDLSNIIISINLVGGQYVIVNYYDFESKCHLNVMYSEVNTLCIGINDLTADEIKDYENTQDIITDLKEMGINAGVA